MNKPMHIIQITKSLLPVDSYIYNVQVFTSVDGGKTFWFGGSCKFAKTLFEAKKIAEKLKKRFVSNGH